MSFLFYYFSVIEMCIVSVWCKPVKVVDASSTKTNDTLQRVAAVVRRWLYGTLWGTVDQMCCNFFLCKRYVLHEGE